MSNTISATRGVIDADSDGNIFGVMLADSEGGTLGVTVADSVGVIEADSEG